MFKVTVKPVKTNMHYSPSRFHYGWVILTIGTIVVAASLGLARFGYTVVLPAMQLGLKMDNTQAGVLATSNLLGYLALSAIGGALASRYGPRAVITFGLLIAGVGMLLTGFANSIFTAAIWRAATGMGSGASNVPVMGLLSAWFGVRRRGLASGIAVAGSSVALIVIGPLVPYALSFYEENGWRVSWFVFGAVTIFIAALAYIILRNRPSDIGIRPLGTSSDEPVSVSGTDVLHWESVYRSGLV